jgi:hypothetical protein
MKNHWEIIQNRTFHQSSSHRNCRLCQMDINDDRQKTRVHINKGQRARLSRHVCTPPMMQSSEIVVTLIVTAALRKFWRPTAWNLKRRKTYQIKNNVKSKENTRT